MTIIQDRIEAIGGGPLRLPVEFVVDVIRQSVDGSAIVGEYKQRFDLVEGELTTDNLDPGNAVVYIPGHRPYPIVIPDVPGPIQLWPLIDAALPTAPASGTGYIRSDDAARLVVLPTSDFNALGSLDPQTMYATYDD